MRYVVFATDFDGTLAMDDVVPDETLQAILDVRHSGRRRILVTGRRLDELLDVFPGCTLFDRVVAENGMVLFTPETGDRVLLGPPMPDELVDGLRARGLTSLQRGEGIVATWRPNESLALDVIRDLGLEYQIAFNKDAVMILPSGVTKATGLAAALRDLRLSRHNVVAVGDAENDHAFLAAAELGVAVSNAVPSLRVQADIVTGAAGPAGCIEVARALLHDDLREWDCKSCRRQLLLGGLGTRSPTLPAHSPVILIVGPPESGKSTLVATLLAQMVAQEYQCCVIDPEGDYYGVANAAAVGSHEIEPPIDTVLELLGEATASVIVNLLALPGHARQPYLAALLARLRGLRAVAGRPHWIVIDEAHHMFYKPGIARELLLGEGFQNVVLAALDPAGLDASLLKRVSHLVSLGTEPERGIAAYCSAVGLPLPRIAAASDRCGVVWAVGEGCTADIPPYESTRKTPRHARKYAAADLGPERSFHFRGPTGRGALAARNLASFLDLSDAVDDPTWLFHLDRGDFAAGSRTPYTTMSWRKRRGSSEATSSHLPRAAGCWRSSSGHVTPPRFSGRQVGLPRVAHEVGPIGRSRTGEPPGH